MPLLNCPSCSRRVFIASNGVCPNCRKVVELDSEPLPTSEAESSGTTTDSGPPTQRPVVETTAGSTADKTVVEAETTPVAKSAPPGKATAKMSFARQAAIFSIVGPIMMGVLTLIFGAASQRDGLGPYRQVLVAFNVMLVFLVLATSFVLALLSIRRSATEPKATILLAALGAVLNFLFLTGALFSLMIAA